MNIATLILETFKRRLSADPERQGFRLSPIEISRDDAQQLADAAEDLGDQVYLVVSAPGVPRIKRSRVFMAPDESAAEQATLWRNQIRPSTGGHLLYVSTEEHDKASGLGGLLSEIRDEDLADTFSALCDEQSSGVPAGVGEALRNTGILDRVPADALCDFAAAVKRETSGGKARQPDAWAVVGKHLPILSLARDTKLNRRDAEERLTANQKLVTRAQVAERRRKKLAGPAAKLESSLREKLAGRSAESREKALRDVDLGAVSSAQLAGKTPRKAAKPRPKQLVLPPPKPIPESPLAPVAPLPSGVSQLLRSLNTAAGLPVEWRVRSDARACLTRLPGGAQELKGPLEASPRGLEGEFGTWSSARAALASALEDSYGDDAMARLVRTPIEVLADPKVGALARSVMDAAGKLYAAAKGASGGRSVAVSVLALDTALVRDGTGPALSLMGPFHPLWLEQALLASVATSSTDPSDTVGRTLLRRSLESPAAPPIWPVDGPAPLRLGRSESGLLVYQAAPDGAGAPSLRSVGRALLERYLELCPHALLGARVAIVRGDPTELVSGMAEVLSDEDRRPALQRLEILAGKAPSLSEDGSELQAAGRLIVSGLPEGDEALFGANPHLVVRFAPITPEVHQAVPGAPTATSDVGGGLLRTHFFMDAHGLQAHTFLSGHPVLEALEATHAHACRLPARGAFITDSRAVSLAAILPTTGSPAATWHVALGPRLGAKPPSSHRLLVYETIDTATSCAVSTREVRPAARAVADGLRQLGIAEDRPTMLHRIANRLAGANASGLLALKREGSQLIAAGVLGLEFQQRLAGDGASVIARLDGAHYATVVGEPAERDAAGAVILAASLRNRGLALTIGYASLDRDADVKVERKQLVGAAGRRLSRIVQVCGLTASASQVGAAAREALSWFLWPAAAAQGVSDDALGEALRRWADGSPLALSIVALLPPTAVPARDKSASVNGVPVEFVPFNAALVNRLVLQE